MRRAAFGLASSWPLDREKIFFKAPSCYRSMDSARRGGRSDAFGFLTSKLTGWGFLSNVWDGDFLHRALLYTCTDAGRGFERPAATCGGIFRESR